MKKLLLAVTILLSLTVSAQEVPDYLKDGIILVRLANGKIYSFSANEYAVVKRGAKAQKAPESDSLNSFQFSKAERAALVAAPLEADRKKNIISGEILRSQKGLQINKSSNQVDAENKYKFGVGLMYQRNIVDDIYLGGRIDSNGGTGLNLGFGF